MKKLILVDGNNLMFRSYYATAYNGNLMKNSKGFPTNALYGFVSMLNKIIMEEKPVYMAVAFDIGKNFRKSEYDFYKEGRISTPEELKMQMPVARKILDAMNIKYLELEPYEADDIIGTLVKMTESDKDFASTIVSSDKDLLQLISDETEVKLLKQTGFIRYTHEKFVEDYGIEPIRMIDLKAFILDSPCCKALAENNISNYSINELKNYFQKYELNKQENCDVYTLAINNYEILEEIETLVDEKCSLELEKISNLISKINGIKNVSKKNYENLYWEIKKELMAEYLNKNLIAKDVFDKCLFIINDLFNYYLNGYPSIPKENF